MMSYRPFLLFLLVTISFDSIPEAHGQSSDWNVLFNGENLENWETYLAKPHPTVDIKGIPRTKEGVLTEVLGVNNDPLNVFSVVSEDGKPAIRISGQIFGALTSLDTYKNYHLRLQFKWGHQKWPPRAQSKRDSGILYHAFGEHGGADDSWMKSQEFQVQKGDVGDYWGVGGTAMDIPAKPRGRDSTYVYTPGAPLVTFSEGLPAGRNCKKYPDNEKAVGKWNTLDLYVFEDKAVHVVNGEVVMVLQNSRYLGEEKEKPLTGGRIQIQSEGAEVYYRNIKIRSIEQLPQRLLPQTG